MSIQTTEYPVMSEREATQLTEKIRITARPAQDFKFLSANELNLLTYAHPGHPISGDATTTNRMAEGA